MNTFSESRHWQAQQCSHEGKPEDGATRQNVVIFSNQLHQSIGIMSFSKNKYYDELKQVDITQAPAKPSENLTFLFHSWKKLEKYSTSWDCLSLTRSGLGLSLSPQQHLSGCSSCTSLRPLIELPTTLFSFMSMHNSPSLSHHMGLVYPLKWKTSMLAYHPSLQRWGHCISNDGLSPSKEGRRRRGPAAISH